MKIQSTKNYGHDSIKMLVYGEPGVGKTTLARTIPEKTLVVSSEGGLLTLAKESIDFVDVTVDDDGKIIPKEKRISRLADIYKYLETQEARSKYKYVFIDSLTELAQNMVEQLYAEFPDRKDGLVMWGEYAKRMRGLIKNFRDLPGYGVVFTALSEWDKTDDGKRVLGVMVNGKISQQLPGFFDEVFHLSVEKDKDGNLTRKLITGKNDILVAKDRSGTLSQFEPADLGVVIAKIKKVDNGNLEKGKKLS